MKTRGTDSLIRIDLFLLMLSFSSESILFGDETGIGIVFFDFCFADSKME